jgi:hypothetical protein
VAAATRSKPALRTPPPRRGRPYLDARSGRMMILPREGGKAIPHIPRQAEPFSASRALRRAGVRTAAASDRGAARTQASLIDFSRTTWDTAGGPGIGQLIVYAFASIIALALLENALGGRGPGAVERILGAFGGGLTKLTSATDPIIGRGVLPAGPSSTVAGGAAVGSLDPTPTPKPSKGLPGFSREPLPTQYAQGGRTIYVDSTIVGQVEQIAKHFGVTVSSGYRDPAHNAEVGGAPRSDHLTGGAVDFVGPAWAMNALRAWAQGRFPYVEPASQAPDHVHISFFRLKGGTP